MEAAKECPGRFQGRRREHELAVADKTIAIVSDMQVPLHDARAVQSFIRFVKDFKPDMLVNVGDDADCTEVGSWQRGLATEYAGTFQAGLDWTRGIHIQFREALGDKPYHVSRSNHTDRLERYIAKNAPALSPVRGLRLEDLLGYDELDMKFHREPFQIAPGWVCAHGDEGSLSRISGRTAGLLAEKWGVSVACGHSHRAGMSFKSYGYAGKVTKGVTGLEVGHLMDLKKAAYLSGGSADWQQAFGILYVRSGRVTPVLVPIQGGKFTVEGKVYG
jgi:hypothetical protein